MNRKRLTACFLLAGLLVFAAGLGQGLIPSAGAPPLAIFLTDESLYLCPLCGDRFLTIFQQLASRIGRDRIWVAVSGVKPEEKTDALEFKAAVKKRIQAFLRSNGIVCPVMDDLSGALRGPGGALPACIFFDITSGSVRSFALPQIQIRLSQTPQKSPGPEKRP